MVRSITDIGHVMGKKVVAESVESLAVLAAAAADRRRLRAGLRWSAGAALVDEPWVERSRIASRPTPARPADPSRPSARPAWVTTSATVASRSARTVVSIFIASIVSSTSPRATLPPWLTGHRRHRSGHRRGDMVRIAQLGLATRRLERDVTAIRHLDRARLPVELEEHRARAVFVRVADREEAHDQRLAALDVDGDFVAGLHAVEEHRRRQHAHAGRSRAGSACSRGTPSDTSDTKRTPRR